MGVRYVINQRGRPQVHNDGQFPDASSNPTFQPEHKLAVATDAVAPVEP